jgi:hypothetical protein
MSGNGSCRKKDGAEGEGGDRDLRAVPQRPLADTDHGFDDDRQHRRLETEKQPLHQTGVLVQRIHDRQCQHGDETGQHEQYAGDQPAAYSMQQPADIGRKLHRFRSGEQHAVVERVQESSLAHPALFLDEDAVHQGNLAGGTTEAQQADLEPDADCLAEGDISRISGHAGRGHILLFHATGRDSGKSLS